MEIYKPKAELPREQILKWANIYYQITREKHFFAWLICQNFLVLPPSSLNRPKLNPLSRLGQSFASTDSPPGGGWKCRVAPVRMHSVRIKVYFDIFCRCPNEHPNLLKAKCCKTNDENTLAAAVVHKFCRSWKIRKNAETLEKARKIEKFTAIKKN